MFRERGQSSTTGSLLLVVVVVVFVGTTGLWILSTTDELAGLAGLSDSTGASLGVAYEGGNVTVEHQGGSAVDIDATTVVLSAGGQTERVPLSAFAESKADGDGQLEAGERLTYAYTPRGERLGVVLVDEPSGGPLLDTTIPVDVSIDLSLSADATSGTAPLNVSLSANGSGGELRPPATDFSGRQIRSYAGSQDSDANSSVIEDGYGVGAYGDSWRAVDLGYTVTQDTVLRFEFRSDDEGEVHGIGLDSQRSSLDGSRIFQLDGTQDWGGGIQDFDDNYTTGDGWQSYEIPVGDYFTGDMQYLVLAMDADSGAGVSEFRNVRLYEENGTGLRYEWSGDSIGSREGRTLNHTFVAGGTYDVSVTATDAAGNSVTETTTVTVGAGPDPVDFGNSTITPYEPNQDDAGGATVIGNDTIELQNNTWKQATLPTTCTVSSNTVLLFEFRSDDEGEIHGIGFDDSNSVDSSRIFKLYGTQNWGIDDYETYEAGDGWVAYEVPVGEYYTGSFDNLAFAMDDDAEADADSSFRNVSVYDRSGDTYTRTCTN